MKKPIGVMDYRYDEGGRYRKEFICPCLNLHTGTDSLSGQCFVIMKELDEEDSKTNRSSVE